MLDAPDGERRLYRRSELADFIAAGRAEVFPYLPESLLDVPALLFGSTDPAKLDSVDIAQYQANGTTISLPPVHAYVLRDVMVASQFGVITCDDMVLSDTTAHLPIHAMQGVEWNSHNQLQMPAYEVHDRIPFAYHLLCANQDNYFHWLIDLLSRFNAAEFCGLGAIGQVADDPCLLIPPVDSPWKQQSFDLIAPAPPRHRTVYGTETIFVERLVYIPHLAFGGLMPHRGLMPAFDRMRAAAFVTLGTTPATPWRKLFVSRADSRNRELVNEPELVALASTLGFEPVVLSGMRVAEPIRMFAEATHIVAAHGAGLTNVVFCRPATTLCEFTMDCYVQWAFRRLAARRGVRYGCIVGKHISPQQDWVHSNSFRIDPAEFAAVLADPAFIGR
jgi:capsular polysaccharide biosynthesis protein